MSMSQGPLASWALASRVRFALVWGGLNVFVFVVLTVVGGSVPIPSALIRAIPVALITLLVQAFIWYPRQMRKTTHQEKARA